MHSSQNHSIHIPWSWQTRCPPSSSQFYLPVNHSEEIYIHLNADPANSSSHEAWSPSPIQCDSRVPVMNLCNVCWNERLKELFCLGKVLTSVGTTCSWFIIAFQACRKRQLSVTMGQSSMSELSLDPNPGPTSSLQCCQNVTEVS